jgi:hypothetical protein
MKKTVAAVLLAAIGNPVLADPLPAPSTYEPGQAAPQPVPYSQPIAPAPAPEAQVDDSRAQFSGKRLAAEIAGGELVSLLVSYATYSSLCDGRDCFGSAIAAFGADFAVTPIAIWAGGRAMGGHGTLGMTYLGASTALAAFSVPGQPDETPADTLQRVGVEMTISALLMPATSALMYEISSQMWFRNNHVSLAVNPTLDHGHTTGAVGSLTVGF